MSLHLKGLLITFMGVLILSPDALLVRIIGGNAWTLLFWRGVLFAIGISILMWLIYRRKTLQQFIDIGRTGFVISLMFTCSTTMFVIGLQYTSIANMLVIISSSPVFAAVFSMIFLHEKVHVRTWITMVVIMLAIAVIVSDSFGKSSFLGDLCALGNAILVAATFTLTRHSRHLNMVPSMGISGIFTALIASIFASSLVIQTDLIPHLLLLGVILTLAFALLTLGPRYISSAEVSLLMPLETVFGTALGWWLLNEVPSSYAFWGGITIIVTLVIHSWLSLRYNRMRRENLPISGS